MAYGRNHPLLVIVEQGLKSEGLLERGYDWYVQYVRPEPAALTSLEFNGVFADWRVKVRGHALAKAKPVSALPKSPSDMTIGELVGGLRPTQLWSVLVAMAALIGGAFVLGSKLLAGR